MARVISIKQLAAGAAAAAEDAHARLERAGFMRMMTMGEPRLSELVEKYKGLGYEVEVLPVSTEELGTDVGCNADVRVYGTVYVRKQNRPAG